MNAMTSSLSVTRTSFPKFFRFAFAPLAAALLLSAADRVHAQYPHPQVIYHNQQMRAAQQQQLLLWQRQQHLLSLNRANVAYKLRQAHAVQQVQQQMVIAQRQRQNLTARQAATAQIYNQLLTAQKAQMVKKNNQAVANAKLVQKRLQAILGPAANDPVSVLLLLQQRPGLFPPATQKSLMQAASDQCYLIEAQFDPSRALSFKTTDQFIANTEDLINNITNQIGASYGIPGPTLQSLWGW